MYTQIKDASSPKTKVYVVGYPKIGQEGGFCHINVRLDAEEIRFANLLANYLNTVIKLAAEYAGVHYVDVEDSLDGYQLCSSVRPTEMAVNGVTVRRGASTFDVITQESFHPTAKGHQLMMEAVMKAVLQNLPHRCRLRTGWSAPNRRGTRNLRSPCCRTHYPIR
jgi:lysophospholipase L1-like esterase